jgi:hypothetical protein
MLMIYMVHVGQNEGMAQLYVGDVVMLERLLPTSQVPKKFQADRDKNTPTRLTVDEARQLLDELRALDLASLKDKQYHRSAMRPDLVTTKKDTVQGFIEFLEAELHLLAS